MSRKQSVLFLCTGNSCRSQMAEAILRHITGERFDVYSAGTRPATQIHPLAVQVLSEIGIGVQGQSPKEIGPLLGRLAVTHLIITCDSANDECPRIFPGMLHRLFWPFPDPAQAEGSPEQILAKFREVRDAISVRISSWLETEV